VFRHHIDIDFLRTLRVAIADKVSDTEDSIPTFESSPPPLITIRSLKKVNFLSQFLKFESIIKKQTYGIFKNSRYSNPLLHNNL